MVLQDEPNRIAVAVPVDLHVAAQSRLQGRDTVPRRGKQHTGHGPTSRPPGPDEHPYPVHDLMRPNPCEPAFVDCDLGHALHTRTEDLGILFHRPRLNTEEIAALLGGGHRRNLLHEEREATVRHRAKGQFPGKPWPHLNDIALVDLEDDAILVKRRDLKQDIAALNRRAELLAEVA